MEDLSKHDNETKIQIILNSRDRDSCSKLGLLPPSASMDKPYYFVSYNHEDYRYVYADIYRLQECGVPIYYDRDDFIVGLEWPEIAERYIDRSECIGVIFYISEEALKSEGIATEIRAIEQAQKRLLPIELPLGQKFGEYAMRDDLPLKEYCDIVQKSLKSTKDINNYIDIYNFMIQYFSPNTTYCSYSKDTAIKAKQIDEFGRYVLKDKVRSKDYKSGFADGAQKGIYEGVEKGRAEGYLLGKKAGIDEGKALGYLEGKEVGIQEGGFRERCSQLSAYGLQQIAQGQEFTVTCSVPPQGKYLLGKYNGVEVHIDGLYLSGPVDIRYKYNGKHLKVRAIAISFKQNWCMNVESQKIECDTREMVIIARAV